MRLYWRRRPRQIDKVRIRISRKAVDVLRISKRMLSLGRSMTAHAIESESCIRNCEWRIVVVDTLSIPNLCPVPTILRSFAVLDHDSPTIDFRRRLELVPRCGR